jgi:hypothetical protein
MLVAPARRCRLIAVFRSVAMTCGPLPVRTWDRSSSKVTSRTRCRRFSMPWWPWTQAARTGGGGAVVRGDDHVDDLDTLSFPCGSRCVGSARPGWRR